MRNSVTKNNALDFTNDEWNQLIDGNGLLIMWFIEWNKKVEQGKDLQYYQTLQIQDFFKLKYNQSAGCDPWHMKNSKISLDGKFVSEGDDDLEPYFLINTDDGVGYIYPYAFVALPLKSGGHHVVRMD
tara:strand:+ start:731 stop:1114 length:384 start_codon:yes stop_codon:yes gene_type:complete